jgi:two-component system C4-dicarboxylate transport response regulator DctD
LRHIVLAMGGVTATDETIVTILLHAGFDAVAVESAAATLALLDGGFEPCVLILDVDMPDMDAWALWEHVRTRPEETRPAAVLLSADRIDATRARVVGIREFLRKPVAPDRLIETVERHCPRRLWPKFRGAEGGLGTP